MTLVHRTSNIRTCYGTAVYIKNDLNCTEIPYRFNVNNVEITVTVLSQPVPNIHLVGIYRSKTVRMSQLIDALTHLHKSVEISILTRCRKLRNKELSEHF